MSIKHSGLLSWFHGRTAPSKHKDHAQDCGTLIEISVRRSCHGLCIPDGVHPLGRHGHLAPPSGRIAAGRLAHDRLRKIRSPALRKTMRKRAQTVRARTSKSTANVMLFEQRLVPRLVLLLDVIEKGTSRRHELQQAAA